MSGYCERYGETACCCSTDGKEYVHLPGRWFDYLLSLGLAPDKAEAAEQVILSRHAEDVADNSSRIAVLEAENTQLRAEREALEKQEPAAFRIDFQNNMGMQRFFGHDDSARMLNHHNAAAIGGNVGRINPLYARPVPARMLDVEWLSNVIREVDGWHTLGAGALAEAIAPRIERHLKGD